MGKGLSYIKTAVSAVGAHSHSFCEHLRPVHFSAGCLFLRACPLSRCVYIAHRAAPRAAGRSYSFYSYRKMPYGFICYKSLEMLVPCSHFNALRGMGYSCRVLIQLYDHISTALCGAQHPRPRAHGARPGRLASGDARAARRRARRRSEELHVMLHVAACTF